MMLNIKVNNSQVADADTEAYKRKEERKKANREQMKKEGKFYLDKYNEYRDYDIDHNTATTKAVVDTQKYFGITGSHTTYGATTPFQHSWGRLVYIGFYKPLIKYTKGEVYLGDIINQVSVIEPDFRIVADLVLTSLSRYSNAYKYRVLSKYLMRSKRYNEVWNELTSVLYDNETLAVKII